MMRRTILLAVVMWFVVCCSVAHAWERPKYEDATVVARSEIIVVGHLKPDTIRHIPHKKKPGEGGSWENHAVLIITQVLKGKCSLAEIPIVIHYGLAPIAVKAGLPKAVVEIHDTGNSSRQFGSLVGDAGRRSIMLLTYDRCNRTVP